MDYLAFLSDFHPVVVHFPIALLPTIALLMVLRRYRPDRVSSSLLSLLLWLAFASCVVAVVLGFGNRHFNGHTGEAVDSHMNSALATTLLVIITALHYSWPHTVSRVIAIVRQAFVIILNVVWRLLSLLGRFFWAITRIVSIPLRMVIWAVRRLVPPLDNAIVCLGRTVKTKLSEWRASILRRTIPANLTPEGLWPALSLAGCLVLVAATGLRGANLSHGETHLVRNMPQGLQAFFGLSQGESASQLDQALFERDVLPVFRRSCIKCHGEHKQKKGLRLDSYATVVKSGVVSYQNPHGSELLRRMLLPPDDPAVMPPPDKGRPLQSDDIGAVIHWLQGHSLASLAKAEGGLPAEIKTLARRLPPVTNEQLEALSAVPGMSVRRLVNNVDLLLVTLSYVPESHREIALDELKPLADHVFHLNVSGLQMPTDEWLRLRDFSSLERLNLARTNISPAALIGLSDLKYLKWLNLYQTAVAASESELRSLMPSLVTVYLPLKKVDG